MRDTFVRTLIEIAKADKDVHLLTGDLGFGVLKPYWEQLPEQFTNVGIAEQNMTGIAAGMALSGKKVFTYSIGNFPTLRCLEQIRNDCAYHDANVKIVCVGGGFVYGSLGMSHHATEDLAIMRALPSMVVMDSVIRLVEGVISKESLVSESFDDNLLDYPNYTKPLEYRGMKVPEVLLSGHHKNIEEFRHSERLRLTKENRPDLLGGNNE